MALTADSDLPRISASNAFHSCDPENGGRKNAEIPGSVV